MRTRRCLFPLLAKGFLPQEAVYDHFATHCRAEACTSQLGESHLYAAFQHKPLHTYKCSWAFLASSFISVPPLHLPLATALCVTEKYGIFIPYLRPSLCSFTVPWKPNFYSCQQITFRVTEECVVAWISSSSFFFFFFNF